MEDQQFYSGNVTRRMAKNTQVVAGYKENLQLKGKFWLEASAYGRFFNNWTGKDASTTIMDGTERSAQSLVSH